MFNWIRSWWITWRVWRNADAEQRRILTSPHDPDDYIELERPHDLAPRRWRTPTGEIIGEAIHPEAYRLLRSDPDEYFRRTRCLCREDGDHPHCGVHPT